MTDYTPMEKMEVHLRQMSNIIVEAQTKTMLHGGSQLMTRTMTIKAGDIILGKIHKEWNVNILASGSMYVMSDPTKDKVRVDAPQVFETGPGSQKLGMAITDCVFMNVMSYEPGETLDEVVDRMTEDSRITKQIERSS